MAGRFLFHKLSSGGSRSTSFLQAFASAPLARPTSSDGCFSNGAAAHPTTVSLYNRGIAGHATRYFNTFSYSCTMASKTSSPINGVSSVITHRMNPTFVGSVRGVKQDFSSTLFTKNFVDWEDARASLEAELEANRASLEAELEANKAAFSEAQFEDLKADIAAEFAAAQAKTEAQMKVYQNEFAAWKAEADKEDAEFNLLVDAILYVFAALVIFGFLALRNVASPDGERPKPSSCFRCQCGCSESVNGTSKN